jgi:hypothetical protein
MPDSPHFLIAAPVIHMHGGDRRFHLHPGASLGHVDFATGAPAETDGGDEIELDQKHFRLAGYVTVQEIVLPGESAVAMPAHVLSCLACGDLVMPADQGIHRGGHRQTEEILRRLDQQREAILKGFALTGSRPEGISPPG